VIVDGEGLDVQARICSMTKSFTAVALMQLRDAGVMELAAPASVYVPELAGWRYDVTVQQLLTMTAGLPTDDAWADRRLDWSPAEFTAFLRGGVTFARPPGVRFEYANLGWAVLGRVLGNVSSSRAQEYVRKHVLEPLRLTRTTWTQVEPTLNGHRITRDVVVREDEPLADGEFSPMGGLWSTAADVCRWMAFLIDGDDDVLSRESRREMQTMHAVASTTDRSIRGYGYGLFVEHDEKLGHVVEHPGGLPGYGTSMRWLPELRVGVVALANLTYAPMTEATLGALDLVTPAEDRDAVSNLARRLAALLADWDPEVENALFADNVLLDVDREERQDEARALGAFSPGEVDAVSATYAVVPLRTANGDALLRVWLTSESPPRVQQYEIQR
jgi:CubicO group peptidase (beta-lactamase class C family)